jgi:hypothetical protein
MAGLECLNSMPDQFLLNMLKTNLYVLMDLVEAIKMVDRQIALHESNGSPEIMMAQYKAQKVDFIDQFIKTVIAANTEHVNANLFVIKTVMDKYLIDMVPELKSEEENDIMQLMSVI